MGTCAVPCSRGLGSWINVESPSADPRQNGAQRMSTLQTQRNTFRTGQEYTFTKKIYSSRHNPGTINIQLYAVNREDHTSLLLEASADPLLGNTYEVNMLLTVTVLCLSHQVICHTNKGWELCHYIYCFCSDLWCSVKVHGSKSVCTS